MGKNIKITLNCLILVILISCNNGLKERKTNYKNGNIYKIDYFDDNNYVVKSEEFFVTGQKKALYNFNNENKNTTYTSYNQKGEITSVSTYEILDKNKCIQTETINNLTLTHKGKVNNNGVKIGWWSVFDKNNNLVSKDQYLIINKERYHNQNIQYNPDGKINYGNSHFVKLSIPDTIPTGRSTWYFSYNPWIDKKSDIFICIGYGINTDYSNLKKIRIDTFFSKKINDRWFGVEFEKPGKKIIKGFIYERKLNVTREINAKHESSLDILSKDVYFEKEVYVKNK